MRTQINHGIGAESLRPHSGHHFVSAGKTFLQLGQDIVFFLLLEACNTGIACGRMGCPQWGHAPACDEILLPQAGQSISWILMVSLLLFYFSVLPDADKNGKSYATFRKSEQKKRCPASHLLEAPLRAIIVDVKGTPVHKRVLPFNDNPQLRKLAVFKQIGCWKSKYKNLTMF